jgi:hypothetical protein
VAHTQRHSEFVHGDDCRVTAALLQAADVLLTEPRNVSERLLRQTLLLPDPPHVLTDQSAHVHAQKVSGLHPSSLSTIVCITLARNGRQRSMSDDPGTEQYRRVAEGLLEAVIDVLIGRKDDLIQHLVAHAKLSSTEHDSNAVPSVALQHPDEDVEDEHRQPGQSGSQVTDSDAGLEHDELDDENDDFRP